MWNLKGSTEATIQSRRQLLSLFSQRALPDLSEMGKEMAAIMSGRNRIDVMNCLRRVDEQSMEGGVYVVVECDDEETWDVLFEKGVPISRNRNTALVYYPAHYLGFESILSVLSVGLLGLSSGAREPRPQYDLVARATGKVEAGTVLTAGGHHHAIDGLEGLLLPAQRVAKNTQVPYYMVDGTRLKRDLQPGMYLTADMLEIDPDATLWQLSQEQDALFFEYR